MRKIKEMIEDYNTKKIAKKHGRTIEQQKYRNEVAKKVKSMRQYGSDLAKTLLEKEKGNIQYVESLGKGRKAGKDVAEQLIESGQLDYVVNNLDKFEGLDYNVVANALIKKGKYRTVAECLYYKKLRGLNKEIAIKLIENKEGVAVGRNYDCFKGLDKDVIQAHLKFGGLGEMEPEQLESIEGLDRETAEMMVDKKTYPGFLFHNLDKFEGLVLDKNMAYKMIEAQKGNPWWIKYLAENIDKFEGLDHKEIAEKLIEKGYGTEVVANLEKFKGLDHKEIAEKLIEKKEGRSVAENIDKFEGLDHKEIAEKLIEKKEGRSVAENINKFECDSKEIAEKLIEKKEGRSVAENIDKFDCNHKDIAEILIEKGFGRDVAENIDKFEGLDKEIAQKLITAGCGVVVSMLPEKFEGLDKEIAQKMIEAGYGDVVAKHPEKFGLKKEK